MQKTLVRSFTQTKVTQGILSTLSFFELYKLPVSLDRLHQLLYRTQATIEEVESELTRLVKLDVVVHKNGLYALSDWDEAKYLANQMEIDKRWAKVKKYYWLLSSIPFVEHISVINSIAMGNADSESDIDFFVITKPNRLYFVRTWVILFFKLLGVYKNRKVTNERFCFGFYITSDNLSIKHLLLQDEDPYLTFWLGTIVPVSGHRTYERFMKENRWIYSWLPNFRTIYREEVIRSLKPRRRLKMVLEKLLVLPAMVFEPILRRIHVRHTFNLPENHWKTSSTIANKYMLKLHAIDPRKELRTRFYNVLRQYK
ncbi:MAG TPA: hypothetical protein VEC17_03165 [Candidatus Binatia bacterium]|nr:hypothetical protein [Candidatus Binatia bacterium]